ncbi:hypothetical protein CCAN12_810016 [Capnocytophaga canimorsus]|nr:hypothetical protein CCAN12_810016 [Capnocytophaga canimorsus]
MAEVVFAKEKGKDPKENVIVNLEEFIAIKGIKALGNQLSTDKVREIKALEPLPYEEDVQQEPSEEEIGDEQFIPSSQTENDQQTSLDLGI